MDDDNNLTMKSESVEATENLFRIEFDRMREEMMTKINKLETEVRTKQASKTFAQQSTQTESFSEVNLSKSLVRYQSTQTNSEEYKLEQFVLTNFDYKINSLKHFIDEKFEQLDHRLIDNRETNNESFRKYGVTHVQSSRNSDVGDQIVCGKQQNLAKVESNSKIKFTESSVKQNIKTSDVNSVLKCRALNFENNLSNHVSLEPVSFTGGIEKFNICAPPSRSISSLAEAPSLQFTYKNYEGKVFQVNREAFTRNLIETSFQRDELANSNVTGARGKYMLDPFKISRIRTAVFQQFPARSLEEEEQIWRGLITKINTKCRGVKRSIKRKDDRTSKVTMVEITPNSPNEHYLSDSDDKISELVE